jgi:hypothetical protein
MSQRSRRFVSVGMALWVALALSCAVALAADGEERPHLIARVNTLPPAGDTYLTIFAPDGTNPGQLIIDSSVQAAMSHDTRWVATWGYEQLSRREVLMYRQVNGRPIYIDIEPGFTAMDATFTRDARYLVYTQAALEPRLWILGIVELETGKIVELVGPADDGSPLGPMLVGNALDLTDERLVLWAYLPFTDGNFGGIYAMDVPGLADAAAGRYAMPSASQLLPGGGPVMMALAPDGLALAFLDYDPANPPRDFEAMGPVPSYNRLRVVDLLSGTVQTLAQAGPGQGLGALTWTPDSASVLFTGGNYRGSYFVSMPRLYIVDRETSTVVEVAPITDDPAESVIAIRHCGDTLFSVGAVDVPTDGQRVTLYSASAASPAARAGLVRGVYIQAMQCGMPERAP